MGIFRFAAFLTRFSSVRGFIFRLFKKNFFSSSSFSQSHSVCDLLASSLKCKLLFSSHTKVLLFRPHITRKKPKTFSMNIYFIKKMLLLLLQSVCMLCYDVHQHHFCKQFIPLYLSFLRRQVRGLKSSSMWLDVKQNLQDTRWVDPISTEISQNKCQLSHQFLGLVIWRISMERSKLIYFCIKMVIISTDLLKTLAKWIQLEFFSQVILQW